MNSRYRPWWRKGRSEAQDSRSSGTPHLVERVPPEGGANGVRFTTDAEMHALYRSIDYLLPATSAKVIQFIGIKGQEGVSTVVRELAATAAHVLQKRVLIIDAAHHNPSQHVHFSVDSAYGWIDAFRRREPVIKACYSLDEHPALFLSPICSQPSLSPWCADEAASAGFFEELKESFDLVLIDSAPALVSADSLTTCRFCDGVIMVYQAEKSWRLAEAARKRIAENGGSLLGAVFNKRTFYIPEFVYRRLY